MSSAVVVTGIGIISSIGKNVGDTTRSLLSGRSGISPISILSTRHKDDFVLGEIKLTLEELATMADVNPDAPWTRTALLGLIAAKEAMNDAGVSDKDTLHTGIVSASTVGGMDRSELFYKDFLNEAKHSKFIDTHPAGDHAEKIAKELGIRDYVATISTACSSSLNSIMVGNRLIHNGILDRVLVGGTDALSVFTLNGFNTLMILDKDLCRPFDESRSGLNLGEGAAFLVLERLDEAIKGKKKIYARVSGYANANDAHHQTASSGDGTGPYLAMKNAIAKAKLEPSDIDYINVHGTGTENNDLTEGIALKRLFKDSIPPFSSTKAYTGHTLGAAGAIESVFSILALENQVLLPNLNFINRIPEIDIEPVKEIKSVNIKHVLTNSFGFGGNDSSLIFSAVK
ncbi:MAG: beta-ketoacyl-[acyl-carrier-protein] synthase family protein [Bacteroidales bacterium]|nr:beta-ketoacyl-[acyl-carrier-protein] synthase family protein [Bacteroidales bacterium]